MRSPVFIVGCPRSGTSLLYHLLLSAGGFAEFHTQMNVYDVLEPIYGDLGNFRNKKRMMREWLQSKAFQVSGLDAADIEAKVLAECRGTSDFLRIVMEEVARKQNVDRWADSTPTNLPHMVRIKRDFPEARFIHIIRDGRDVALSLDRRGWSRPLPWDRDRSLLAAGLYWEWIVRRGREYGGLVDPSYLEVRYEDLVSATRDALARIAGFIQHDLDYGRIQRTGVGSVKTPLTAFKEELGCGEFRPVGRWKRSFPPRQLIQFEELVGDYLLELGYPLTASPSRSNYSLRARGARLAYWLYYSGKQWAKVNTPLSRAFVNYSAILIDK
jgi:hypothetical protein